MSENEVYGTTRARAPTVSYGEVERAAITILKTDRRSPSVAKVRDVLGRGSPNHIAECLKRFWGDLGARIEGDPVALSRLPSDIVDLADGIWRKALTLANEAALHDDNAARERLERLLIENDVRAQSFALREKEYEAAERARETALQDTRDHLLSTMRMLERDRAELQARDRRIINLEAQIASYRTQVGTVIARAIARNRIAVERKPRRTVRRKPSPKRSTPAKPLRGRKSGKRGK